MQTSLNINVMKTPKGEEVFVFDHPKSFDRFTIITEDGSLFGASRQPFNALGFGQYCGDVDKALDDDLSLPDAVAHYIDLAREDADWLGKEITSFSELPEDVQKYVEQIAE